MPVVKNTYTAIHSWFYGLPTYAQAVLAIGAWLFVMYIVIPSWLGGKNKSTQPPAPPTTTTVVPTPTRLIVLSPVEGTDLYRISERSS